MQRALKRFGFAVAILGLLAGRAQATLTTYTSQAAFQAAAGSTTTETFAGPTSDTTGLYGPVAFNGFTLSGNGNANGSSTGNHLGVHNGSVSANGPNFPIPAAFAGQNFFSWGDADTLGTGASISLTFTFTVPTFAFGFDWFNTDFSDQYQIQINPDGTQYTAPPFTLAAGNAAETGFFGVVSTNLITSALITRTNLSGGYTSDEGFDNVRVQGAVGVATPEPSTIASACVAGLAGLFVVRRRKRA